MGSNPDVTRTPDAHFLSEARHDGAKLVVLSPDLSATSKHADWWIPVHSGQDGAFWMAVDARDPARLPRRREGARLHSTTSRATATRRSSSGSRSATAPSRRGGSSRPSELDALPRRSRTATFKYLVWDGRAGAPRMPLGCLGFRWQSKKGEWNLAAEGRARRRADRARPCRSSAGHDAVRDVAFADFADGRTLRRGVPVKIVQTARAASRSPPSTTCCSPSSAWRAGLAGRLPVRRRRRGRAYTPAWQESFTGVDRKDVVRFAHEWATTAEQTGGKCSIIIGAGMNHWYHADLTYRAAITALLVTGCVGKNGGGLNHYVGQEKLAPVAPWATLAGALDWGRPPRLPEHAVVPLRPHRPVALRADERRDSA